jgi:hypothetical protein
MHVHLQGLGMVPALPARELRVGDRRLFNYGYVYDIVDVETGPKWIVFELRDPATGKSHTCKHKPDTLIPCRRDG